MSSLATGRKHRFDVSTMMRMRKEGPELVYAVVAGSEDGGILAETPMGEVAARRAASCLLQPEKGDRVLMAHDDGKNWILAVLERPEKKDALLCFDKSVRMHTPEGGIHLSASTDISMVSSGLSMNANKTSAVFNSFHLAVQAYNSCIDKATSVVEKVDLFCKNMRQHLVRSSKVVEGHEEEYSGSRRMVTNTMDMKSQTTEIQASERVSVNSTQFHVN